MIELGRTNNMKGEDKMKKIISELKDENRRIFNKK